MDTVMKFGVNLLPLVPCRSEPSDKSEMVTQLLFGELYKVQDGNPRWILIEILDDGYTCWIDRKQHHQISKTEFERLKSATAKRVAEPTGLLHCNEGVPMCIPLGAPLPGIDAKGVLNIDGKKFRFNGSTLDVAYKDISAFSLKFLNAPYLWGGKSVMGIDCSGFIQLLFIAMGYQLPRDAYQQAEHGDDVAFAEESMAGDLAYFENDKGKITHVGMVTEPGKIIHASGRVRIDSFDHRGIYNADTETYTHRLRLIKRITLLAKKA
ncbi:MAG: NlpC/P60 family protein [Cryomorphaceae bacterium]